MPSQSVLVVQFLRLLERTAVRSPIVLLLATLALQGAHAATSVGNSSALGDEIMARLGQVPQRQQTFHETREIRALTAPLRSQGVLLFRRPDYIEKKTLAPRPEDLVVNGSTISITRGTAPARLVDAAHNPGLALLVATLRGPLEGDAALLKQYYRLDAAGDLGSWTLTLTPARPEVARFVQSVTMVGHNNAIASVRVLQANGDVQTTTIDP